MRIPRFYVNACSRLERIPLVQWLDAAGPNAKCRWREGIYFAGTVIGAFLSLMRNTKNLAGLVLLALRLIVCMS